LGFKAQMSRMGLKGMSNKVVIMLYNRIKKRMGGEVADL
jgi:hypothetical protein